MEKSEIILYVVLTIIFIFPIVVGLFVLLTGIAKSKLDEAAGENTSWLGWVIAVLIAGAIFYAIATTDDREPNYRHSFNIDNKTYHVV